MPVNTRPKTSYSEKCYFWGLFINYVDKEGAGGVSQMTTYAYVVILSTKGEGGGVLYLIILNDIYYSSVRNLKLGRIKRYIIISLYDTEFFSEFCPQ